MTSREIISSLSIFKDETQKNVSFSRMLIPGSVQKIHSQNISFPHLITFHEFRDMPTIFDCFFMSRDFILLIHPTTFVCKCTFLYPSLLLFSSSPDHRRRDPSWCDDQVRKRERKRGRERMHKLSYF